MFKNLTRRKSCTLHAIIILLTRMGFLWRIGQHCRGLLEMPEGKMRPLLPLTISSSCLRSSSLSFFLPFPAAVPLTVFRPCYKPNPSQKKQYLSDCRIATLSDWAKNVCPTFPQASYSKLLENKTVCSHYDWLEWVLWYWSIGSLENPCNTQRFKLRMQNMLPSVFPTFYTLYINNCSLRGLVSTPAHSKIFSAI